MTLALRDCTFAGPALPEPFVKFELERQLAKLSPIPKISGPEGRALQSHWDTYRNKLRELRQSGGDLRVLNHVIEPLAPLLGYGGPRREEKVRTREGDEDGGWWLQAPGQAAGLRAWTVALGIDLDAPNRRGRAYRFSPARVAARVLLAKGERAGLLTDGQELRLLLCDTARPDSHVAIALDRSGGWRGARDVPDSLRLLVALSRPAGVAALPELVEAARLSQTTVTRKLREQARNAVRDFVQGVLDEPGNGAKLGRPELAKTLWEEGLILVYRLLFILKMESSSDPSRAFSFAATSLWRNSYSPNTALAPAVRDVLAGVDTGGFLEHSLRTLFRLFSEGLESAELKVSPLGGALFGSRTTPVLDDLSWGEPAVAHLLDALLWTPGDKRTERERVHYGSLDVEDLGRVYEALLELEPGITSEPMCRLRRAKLEVVVPAAQGTAYRTTVAVDAENDDEPEQEDDESPKKGRATTTVAWVEDIAAGRFFLRTGLGRKSSGSYYTPHPFVRFLVQETLGPQLAERSPHSDPQPLRILALKVLDPAMGSGHFLVEACRFLGDALYEACRICDERASTAEESGNHALAADLRKRVADLPDPNDELLEWLPSRAPEGTAGGLSHQRALALCRRLVAVHCLYGVDKNRLAVELAKLSLWLESYAEGLPLTFLDHRLVCGDSLTGPFLEDLFTWPEAGGPIGDDLFTRGLRERLTAALGQALDGVQDLTASVGKDVADLERKAAAKARLDAELAPFRTLAAAWSAVRVFGNGSGDELYKRALRTVVMGPDDAHGSDDIHEYSLAFRGVPFDLIFPEVFYPRGWTWTRAGFHAVVGNPPWDKPHFERTQLSQSYEDEWGSNPDVAASLDGAHREARATASAVRWRLGAASARPQTRGHIDVYFGFCALSSVVLVNGGRLGLVLGGGWAKNPAAQEVRRLMLSELNPIVVAQFDNDKLCFADLPAILEFCLAVCERPSGSVSSDARVGLRLKRFTDLDLPASFQQVRVSDIRTRAKSGEQLALSTLIEGPTARRGVNLWELLRNAGLDPVQEINLTSDPLVEALSDVFPNGGAKDPRFEPLASALLARGYLPALNGRSIQDYDGTPTEARGHWSPVPTHVIKVSDSAARGAQYYRMTFRRTCGSPKSNERSMRAAMLPPGLIAGDSLVTDISPSTHPTSRAMVVLGVLNSFPVDALLRPKVQTKLGQAILTDTSAPSLPSEAALLIAHAALRLTCNHAGYAFLWAEQLGDAWREPTPRHTWPVLADDDARWAVRTVIDALVASAYGLSRDQYVRLLDSFSHKSYPQAPTFCLAAFDELQSIGLDAFVTKRDPYYDIPLNETLPIPVIDFGSIFESAPMGDLFAEPR